MFVSILMISFTKVFFISLLMCIAMLIQALSECKMRPMLTLFSSWKSTSVLKLMKDRFSLITLYAVQNIFPVTSFSWEGCLKTIFSNFAYLPSDKISLGALWPALPLWLWIFFLKKICFFLFVPLLLSILLFTHFLKFSYRFSSS